MIKLIKKCFWLSIAFVLMNIDNFNLVRYMSESRKQIKKVKSELYGRQSALKTTFDLSGYENYKAFSVKDE